MACIADEACWHRLPLLWKWCCGNLQQWARMGRTAAQCGNEGTSVSSDPLRLLPASEDCDEVIHGTEAAPGKAPHQANLELVPLLVLVRFRCTLLPPPLLSNFPTHNHIQLPKITAVTAGTTTGVTHNARSLAVCGPFDWYEHKNPLGPASSQSVISALPASR
jgi:hypothetical protein